MPYFSLHWQHKGVNSIQIRGARGVPIHAQTPLRLDIGKKMQGALCLCSVAPPELVTSIQSIFRSLGIKVFSLDSLLAVSECDLGVNQNLSLSKLTV